MNRRSVTFLLSLLAFVMLLSFACKQLTGTEYYIDPLSCNGCGECIRICPNDAIYYNQNGEARIDQTKCTHCAECVAVCPNNAVY
ncbi:MAG TPA: 4Fe-4S binding protein [Candidatus Syntrophosphaera sp.]|nr:4Fe-4S binding protein [Candidatus Syntrophosphaera sp.]